jgi:hypothetical protein
LLLFHLLHLVLVISTHLVESHTSLFCFVQLVDDVLLLGWKEKRNRILSEWWRRVRGEGMEEVKGERKCNAPPAHVLAQTFLLLHVIYLFEQLWLHGSQVLVQRQHYWIRGNAAPTRINLMKTLHKHGHRFADALSQGAPRHPSRHCLGHHWRLKGEQCLITTFHYMRSL